MSGREVPVAVWADSRAIAGAGCGHECYLQLDGSEEDGETALVLATDYAVLLAEHEALLARVEAAECDAERYRWLRNKALWAEWYDGTVRWTLELTMAAPDDDPKSALDAAIDAARQGE